MADKEHVILFDISMEGYTDLLQAGQQLPMGTWLNSLALLSDPVLVQWVLGSS